MPVVAVRLAGAVLAGRNALPRVLAGAGLSALTMLVVLVAPLAVLSSVPGAEPGAVPEGIPADFVPVYRESARTFGLDWLVLASIHRQETGFSTDPTTYHGLNSAGCCAGPFQINVTNGPPSTWDSMRTAYRLGRRPTGYPHPATPHPSVYDDFDAAMAAGALLRVDGADRGLGSATWNAVRAYNGSGPVATAYADAVMARARAWAQIAPPIGGAGPVLVGGALVWPVRGPITSPFCERRPWESCHPGIDIAVPSGTPILAAGAGRVSVVQSSSRSGGYGEFTCIAHSADLSTCYAHQGRVLVHVGQVVARGQLIGISDCTGRCFGPHLHFEVRLDGEPVCPAPYLGAPRQGLCAKGAPGA